MHWHWQWTALAALVGQFALPVQVNSLHTVHREARRALTGSLRRVTGRLAVAVTPALALPVADTQTEAGKLLVRRYYY